MFKKICFTLVLFALTACESSVVSRSGLFDSSLEVSEISISSKESIRVGVLLPLSGNAAKHGQGLKNAAMMALDDIPNNNLILQFYDTKGTPEGARVAVENALNQRTQLIIGPLMSTEVSAISDKTVYKNVPVIAFSTSENVLRPDVYTLGLLIDEQVDRIMSFAAQKGRQRFALLLPDNDTGIAVARAAVKSARKNDVSIARVAFYPPNTTDFSNVLKEMTDHASRKKNADDLRRQLMASAEQGDARAERQLKSMGKNDVVGEVDFDAVLIPENGPRLKSAIAMFGYYDIYAPKVKFLGTSIWENTNLSQESVARGAWYPALSRVHSTYFSNKYQDLYGEKPSALYSLAYDGIALAASLAKQSNRDFSMNITNPEGYVGVNGVFRLFEDGSNQHSLDIFEVRSQGDVVIDLAPKKFSTYRPRVEEGEFYNDNMEADQIQFYGKDAEMAKRLMFEDYGKSRYSRSRSIYEKANPFGYWSF